MDKGSRGWKAMIFILIALMLLMIISGCKQKHSKFTSLHGSIGIMKANATSNRATFVFKNNLLHPVEVEKFTLENDIVEPLNLIDKPIVIKYNSHTDNLTFTIPGLCTTRDVEKVKVTFKYFDMDMANTEYYSPKVNLTLNCN